MDAPVGGRGANASGDLMGPVDLMGLIKWTDRSGRTDRDTSRTVRGN
jgi:hypothetical protein